MKAGVATTLLASLLLLASTSPVEGKTAPAHLAKSVSHEVQFRDDDLPAQSIAKRALGTEYSEEEDAPAGANSLWTAWVNISHAKPPALFVMYGCSPTGNCGLYGYERSKSGWRMVLDSLAQTCSILPSSHGGRHDISASMHGSATEGTLKTYWWHKNRYVRVSERNVVYK